MSEPATPIRAPQAAVAERPVPLPLAARVPVRPVSVLALPGLAIRRAMAAKDVERVEAKLHANANALLTKDDRHYKIAARTPDGQNFTLLEVDPSTPANLDMEKPPINVTRAELMAQYTLDRFISGDVNHPTDPANVTKPIVGASMLEHDDSPVSMTHHTFDLVKPQPAAKGKAQSPDNLADNHHLTIDNALPAMLATPKPDLPEFFAAKQENTKKEFNESLNEHEFHSIDNLHFVPPTDQQGASKLPARHANLKADNRARPAPRDATEIEKGVTLQTFRAYLARAFAAIGIDAELGKEILAALDRTQAQLGVAANQLHLAADQRVDFTRLVLLVHKQSGGTIDPAHKVPPELEGIIEPKARITLRSKNFGATNEEKAATTQKYKAGLKAETWARIASDIKDEGKKTKNTCNLYEGTDSSTFNEVLTFLVNLHWEMIKKWTIDPPAQAVPVNPQPANQNPADQQGALVDAQ